MLATLLTIAAIFWNVSPATPVTVQWDGATACQGAVGIATPTACAALNDTVIHVIPDRWTTLTNADKCTVIAHEYGHLLGHEHSDDPTNIMYLRAPQPATCRRYNTPPRKGARYAMR